MTNEPRFEEIRPRTRRLGRPLVHLARTRSTMEEARRRALAGAPEGLVVVADEQTAGVGRLGRSWHSPAGGLWCTVLLRPRCETDRLRALPLAAGLAVVDAIGTLLNLPARLKWPNDVVLDERKVGGVLVDARLAGRHAEFVLVGLGVNGDARTDDFPPELRGSATSLSLASGHHVCMPALLKLLLEALEPSYESLEAGRAGEVVGRVRLRMATLGRRVRVERPSGLVEGVASDLGPSGELLVETRDGWVRVQSGECLELRSVA